MSIRIGRSKHISHQEVSNIVDFCLSSLGIREEKMDLQIHFGNTGDPDCWASTICPINNHRKFLLVIRDKIYRKDLILGVLCHELTHVRQFIRAHIRPDGGIGLGYFWKGRFCKVEKNMRMRDYINLPWEKEANSVGFSMRTNYLKMQTGKDKYR
jgi:hypothetical protein